jgi:phosphatidylinositol alpha-1,6-mannosyltransferase
VLALSPTFLPVQGGAERLLHQVLRRVQAHHDIELLTAEPPARHAGPLPPGLPFPVHRYIDRRTLERVPVRRLHRGLVPPFSLSAAEAALRLARAVRPDVVWVHYAVPTGLAGWLAARRQGVPWVLSLVGRDVPGPGVPPGWRPWVRRLARAADGVTYISDYCREAIFGRQAVAPGVTVGAGVAPPRAVAEEEVAALRGRLGLVPGGPVLLAVQRLVPYKGVEVLVDAMAQLEPEATLLIAGRGPEGEALAARAARLGLAERMRLLGFVPDEEMPALLALTDVFVFHSRYETFGLAAAEAMAAGLPVVAAATTAIPEVVRDGRDGVLVPPDDPRALAAAVARLLGDPAERARLGASGRARALADFGWDAVAERYRLAIERAVGRRAGAWPLPAETGSAGAQTRS